MSNKIPKPTAEEIAGDPPEARKPVQRRPLDFDLQAMAKLDRLMAEVPEEAVDRVVMWFITKYGPPCKATLSSPDPKPM